MKNFLLQVIVSFIVVTFAMNVPASWFDIPGRDLGASVTTLNSTDSLSDFPTTYNNNLNAVNDDLESLEASTTLSLLTSAPNLATVGTVTTGTWNADTVTETNGGTGFATYTTGDVLYSDSSNSLAKLGIGSTDEVLKVSGGVPVWGTDLADLASNYAWTGTHTFASSATHNGELTGNATTTIDASNVNNSALVLNSLAYKFPASRNASSTLFSTDGSGNLSWVTPASVGVPSFIEATTTTETFDRSTIGTSETQYGTGDFATLPGGVLGTDGALKVKVYFNNAVDSGNDNDARFIFKLGGTEICREGYLLPASAGNGVAEFIVFNDGSESSQKCMISIESASSFNARTDLTAAVDTSSDKTIEVFIQFDGGTDNESITLNGMEAYTLGQ